MRTWSQTRDKKKGTQALYDSETIELSQSPSSLPSHLSMRNRNPSPNPNFSDMEGGFRGRGGGLSAADANSNILEQQNNERISDLSQKVSLLKGLTIDIGNEVREQNSMLDNMGDTFSNTSDLLHGSLQRIGVMLQTAGGKHMCYMVAFSVVVMIILWRLMH